MMGVTIQSYRTIYLLLIHMVWSRGMSRNEGHKSWFSVSIENSSISKLFWYSISLVQFFSSQCLMLIYRNIIFVHIQWLTVNDEEIIKYSIDDQPQSWNLKKIDELMYTWKIFTEKKFLSKMLDHRLGGKSMRMRVVKLMAWTCLRSVCAEDQLPVSGTSPPTQNAPGNGRQEELCALAARPGRLRTSKRADQDVLYFSRVQQHSLVLSLGP